MHSLHITHGENIVPGRTYKAFVVDMSMLFKFKLNISHTPP